MGTRYGPWTLDFGVSTDMHTKPVSSVVSSHNKVVAKVIFLHVSVILFTGGVPDQQLHPTPWPDTAPWNQTCTLGPDMSPRPGMPPGPDPLPGPDTPPWDQTTSPPGTRHTPPDQACPTPPIEQKLPQVQTPPRHALLPWDQTWPCDYRVFHREFLWPTSAKLVPNGFQH